MPSQNREVKSTVFADLFGNDELVGKRNFLSLYNAIHGSCLKLEDTVIEIKTIDQSVYHSFHNDISMLINGKLIVFVEHQSTLNDNMPLRFLEYFVHILYGMFPARSRYRKKHLKIPTPEFYVFYNGPYNAPLKKELRLSDAFTTPQKKTWCELIVQFRNIRKPRAKKLSEIQNCDTLREYCRFMDIIFKHQSKLGANATKAQRQESYNAAIKEAVRKKILPDYLPRKITEVINMFLDEYDYDTDIEVQREEAKEEKAEEAARNLLAEGDSPEKVARCIGLPLEEVLEIVESLSSDKTKKSRRSSPFLCSYK